MNWQLVLEIAASIMGIVMSLGYYPQAYKIFKKKSGENVSLLSYSIFTLGTSTWMMYGIYIKSWTIIISFIFGVIGSWLTLILLLKYKTKR